MPNACSKAEVVAVFTNDEVVATSEVRRLKERVRELEHLLDRKTMEVEMLMEALDLARSASEVVVENLSDLPTRLRTAQAN